MSGKNAVLGIVMAAAMGTALPAAANNLRVSGARLSNADSVGKTMDVAFDLTWENSWRSDSPACMNWDAAWVFVKFRAPGSNNWEHAKLSASSGDHAAPGGVVDVGVDVTETYGVGAFIYSATLRTGDVSYAGTRLKWTYGANGYDFAPGAVVEVSVHAIEMVYVPEGPFWAGNTNGIIQISGQPASFHALGNDLSPAYISSGDAFTLYWGVGDTSYAAVPAAYPNGYGAFYCMKYEVTQGQYADFLNRLTRVQQAARASIGIDLYALTASASENSVVLNRNAVRCASVIPPAPEPVVFGCDANGNRILNEADDAQDRACNYLSWDRGIAYADWAGLRPMSELEFEKACRGFAEAVDKEFAWGSATYVTLTSHTGTDGNGTETAVPANANSLLGATLGGPVRAGIFAAGRDTRVLSGASYWGIMELSGSVCEWTVRADDAAGRAFTGANGDGILAANGAANTPNWGGSFYRGGSYLQQTTPLESPVFFLRGQV